MTLGGELWDWALSAYAKPGVEATCLALQDEHGLDVDVILWLAWRASRGEAPTVDGLAEARALSEAFQVCVVAPLRSARRALRPPPAGVVAPRAAALRDAVLSVELAAEQVEMEGLEALPADPANGAPTEIAKAQFSAYAAEKPAASAPLNTLVTLLFDNSFTG